MYAFDTVYIGHDGRFTQLPTVLEWAWNIFQMRLVDRGFILHELEYMRSVTRVLLSSCGVKRFRPGIVARSMHDGG